MTKVLKTKNDVLIDIEECAGYVPLDCPVCCLSMRDANDANAFRSHMCCAECKMTWAEPNSAIWSTGWRPDEETLNIYKFKLSRQPTYLLR